MTPPRPSHDVGDIDEKGGDNNNKDDQQKQQHQHQQQLVDKDKQPHYDDALKIFINRIPSNFDSDSVRRILEAHLDGPSSVTHVLWNSSSSNKEDDDNTEQQVVSEDRFGRTVVKKKKQQATKDTPHKGYAFCVLRDTELVARALELRTVKGGAKATSKRHHTLYIGPCYSDQEKEQQQQERSTKKSTSPPCFLWAQNRCPYGTQCQFSHDGPGGCSAKCLLQQNSKADTTTTTENNNNNKKIRKCRDFRKNKKCKLGDQCPFSHDFEPQPAETTDPFTNGPRPDSEKDCINWKTKGKCRKLERGCPYRHDPKVQEAALQKMERKKKKKRKNSDTPDNGGNNDNHKRQNKKNKQQQPLSVRVFGLNYETKQEQIEKLFAKCGTIRKIEFPTFEDSGRCKGYCQVNFSSPKAVQQAILLDKTELDGRWLSIQAGKMYLEEWEQQHQDHHQGQSTFAKKKSRTSET